LAKPHGAALLPLLFVVGNVASFAPSGLIVQAIPLKPCFDGGEAATSIAKPW
jgi:hypothetical protein